MFYSMLDNLHNLFFVSDHNTDMIYTRLVVMVVLLALASGMTVTDLGLILKYVVAS